MQEASATPDATGSEAALPPTAVLTPEQELQEALTAEQSSQPTALAARGTKRGRKPQDPNQVVIGASCSSEQEFGTQLRAFLADASHDRHHVLFEATFPTSAAFLVDYGPAATGKAKSNSYKYGPAFAPMLGQAQDGHLARSMSVMEALTNNPEEPKERMRKQRAIARAMENIVEKVDGYRYAFHNEWLARDNDAYRFSYFCNDSLLNKDRTLGGVKKNDANKVQRARKQVYDCQGYLTVKFSATRQCLEVLYKHIPLHMTYDERAPLPRVGTKRFQILELTDPNHELVRRAKEVENRKRLAASGAPTPKRTKRSKKSQQEGESSAGLGQSSADADFDEDANRSLFEESSVVDSPSGGPNRAQSEAMARDANEVADLKAKLAAAEQQIQRLQAANHPLPPGWSPGVPQQWYPPYGPGPAIPGPPMHASPGQAHSPPQLSATRTSGTPTEGQPLFQVMSLRGGSEKKKPRPRNKKSTGDAAPADGAGPSTA